MLQLLAPVCCVQIQYGEDHETRAAMDVTAVRCGRAGWVEFDLDGDELAVLWRARLLIEARGLREGAIRS